MKVFSLEVAKKLMFFLGGILIVGAVCLAILKVSSSVGTKKTTATQPKLVMTTILPVKYFADRLIAGLETEFTTVAIVPTGYSPESYEPTPQQVIQLAQAELLFQVGLLPVETTQLKTLLASQSQVKVVTIDPGTELLELIDHHHEGEVVEAATAGEHDPHTWLDPVRVRILVANMKQELQLIATTEATKNTIEKNWQQLDADLVQLDALLVRELASLRGTKVMVYHPELAYLGRRYGFSQLAFEVEGKEPSLAEIKILIEEARHNKSKALFIQPQYSSQSAQAIAQEIGGVVVPIDPLAYDYLTMMRTIAAALQESSE